MEVQHKIVMSQVMLPHQANVAGNVHGGEIMKFMDMAAAAVAMKFSKGNCVTARVDELLFHLPIFVGALVTCTASLVYVAPHFDGSPGARRIRRSGISQRSGKSTVRQLHNGLHG